MSETRRNRTVQVAIRFTVDEFEALRREGNRRSWTFAQVVRKRALKGLDVAVVSVGDESQKAVG